MNARLARTGWDVMATVVACVVTGIAVARDLHRDLSDKPLSHRKFLLRMLAVAATVFLGLRLIFVITPMLHPSFYEALFRIFERRDFVAIVGTVGLFGIGLAARAVAPRGPAACRPRPWRWATQAVGILLLPILAILGVMMYSTFLPPASLESLPRLASAIDGIRTFTFQLTETYPLLGNVIGLLLLNTLCWGSVLLWLMTMVVLMNVQKPNAIAAPLDQIGATRARLGWFVWCSTGVTAVCLAALPTFALGGLVVFHCRIHAEEFFGWKLP